MSFTFNTFGSTKSQWPIVNLKTLGTDKNVSKKKVLFVPLFGKDIQDMDIDLGNDKPAIPIDTLTPHVFVSYQYTCIFPHPSDPGKLDWRNFSWLDSNQDYAEDNLADPGIMLGLREDPKVMKKTPGFNGASPGKYTPSNTWVEWHTLPVLWDVKVNSKNQFVEGSGTPALLRMKSSQANKIFSLFDEPAYSMTENVFKNQEGELTELPFNGSCFILSLDKDVDLKFDTYIWKTTNTIVPNSIVTEFRDQAINKLNEQTKKEQNLLIPYQPIIDQFAAGHLDGFQTRHGVFATIIRGLFEIWEIDNTGTDQEVIDKFLEVLPKYDMHQGSDLASVLIPSNNKSKKEDKKEDLF